MKSEIAIKRKITEIKKWRDSNEPYDFKDYNKWDVVINYLEWVLDDKTRLEESK